MNNLELEAYLADLLDQGSYTDYAPNGIQIEGKPQIQKIATAVTASLAVVEKAVSLNVDALLVHHGYFWKGEPYPIRGFKKARIATLIKNDINLFAYHLPLDNYPMFGNNASIAQRLNIELTKQHDLLWTGQLPKPMHYDELFNQLQKIYGKQVQGVFANLAMIKNIAWCSGAAYDYFEQAIALNVDVFITGEFSERTYHLAKEAQVNFFAAGHHATEKDGIRNLGVHLAEKFDLKHCFIDEENPF